ncbi:MAG: J domain-containing protein [Haloferacaceae archaeon]
MNRERLLVALGAVFAGLTMLLVVVALARQPFLLVVAVPFAATTYFIWYHVSGRLAARVARQGARDAADRGPRADGFGGPGGRRRAAGRARAGSRRRGSGGRGGRGASPGAGARTGRQSGGRRGGDRRTEERWSEARQRATPGRPDRMSPEEAARILGVAPDADAAAVKRAYREKVKSVHPDTESGDEASFRRVNRAYERLSE